MRKAIKLGILATVVSFVVFHYSRRLNPRDEDLLLPEDTLPYVPHREDSGAPILVDSALYVPRDTTPYKGNWIDVN